MQVKESVNAANLLLVGAGMDISAVKPDVNNAANFADYFDKAQNNNAIAGTNVKDSKSQNTEVQKSQNQDSKAYNAQGKGQTENVDNRAVDNKAVDNQTVDNGMSETVPDNANVSDAETAEQMTDFGETELVEEAVIQIPELSDEEMESVLEILGSLLQTVTEQFQFPVQELTDKLKEFDMEPKDLLSEEGLKKFFLQMNSAEVSDLIVDEVLNQDLQSFVAEADSLLQQIDSELPQVLPEQQMEDLLVEALSIVQEPAEITEVVEEVPYVRSNAPVGEVPEVEEEEPQEQQVVKEITEEPEVIVTNERHSESKGNQTASKEHESE